MPVARYLCIFINVGLGEGSALPVGVPVPWPSVTPPTGWLKCNGAAFSAEEYPELAKVYPTNKLPDLRGEFIRGWDDGRGIDSGRTLLSAQDGSIEAQAMITMGSSILLAVLPGLIRRMRDTGHIRDLHHHMAGAKPVHEILHLTIS